MIKQKKGFTLIEILVSVAIVGIVAITLFSVYGRGIRGVFFAGDRTEVLFEVQGQLNRYNKDLVDEIVSNIENSSPIVTNTYISNDYNRAPSNHPTPPIELSHFIGIGELSVEVIGDMNNFNYDLDFKDDNDDLLSEQLEIKYGATTGEFVWEGTFYELKAEAQDTGEYFFDHGVELFSYYPIDNYYLNIKYNNLD